MKYLYLAAGILVVLILLIVIWILVRRHRARCRVCCRTDEEKCRDLNNALFPFGFQYDICCDLFYSTRDAWQREMGYGRIYDEHAIGMNMIIDCEPLYFSYEGRNYLLELWKGQYGMASGAEIGFYVSDEMSEHRPEKLFYHSVTDEAMLNMRFVLRKRNRMLAVRESQTWWLTGFVLGEYSCKEELHMDVSITFPDCRMRNAFYEALLQAGYTKEEIRLCGTRVSFCFVRPRTVQPRHCRLRVLWVQWKNRHNCKKYLRVTRYFVRTIDRVDYLGMCFPRLYRMLGRFSRIPAGKCRRRR